MRLKHSHNFLGGSVPFCYRGIFSGLSNETVGTALYFHPLYHYYFPLLYRYARRLTAEDSTAFELAADVLKDQYAIDGVAVSANLRALLRVDLYNRCSFFNQSRVFDRPPLKLPITGLFL
ncbi:MAG: hypothetical protein ABJA78_20075 [Ferruginibacter sp.]